MLERKISIKDLLIIIVVYLSAQWLLFIVSGYWWDDSGIKDLSVNELKEVYNQTGVVFSGFWSNIMVLFRRTYKIWVFVFGLCDAVLFYLFCKNSEIFSANESLWITLLFITIPINDARMTYICFPYWICLSLFCLVLYFTAIWKRQNGAKRWVIRVICWGLLFVSYSTASLLVFTSIIILWLYYIDLKDKNAFHSIKGVIREFPGVIVRNIDYIIVPCVYWIIKTIFFSPYGNYVNYNQISLASVISNVIKFPIAILGTVVNVFNNYESGIERNTAISMVLLVVAIICGGFLFRKAERNIGNSFARRDIVLLVVGVVVYMAGLFAYAVVRNGGIETTGVDGRDSLLLGFGTAICIYFAVRIFLTEWVRYISYLLIILVGVLHFNIWYLNYQGEWYESLEFMDVVATEQDIKNNDTFWVVQERTTSCGIDRFYNKNINASDVLGEQTRFFANMELLATDWCEKIDLSTGYGMDDYDFSDMTIDGILILHNETLSLSETVRLKILEMTDQDKFDRCIKDLDRYEYIKITPEKSQELKDAYNSGIIDDEKLLMMIRN